MVLVPIQENLADNHDFLVNPDWREGLEMSVAFFKNVGYHPPWIGYYAKKGDQFVGNAAFKGRPLYGKVEIAYGIFPQFQQLGYGTEVCESLVAMALATDPSVLITARTLREENYSTKILRKNGFQFSGTVLDPDDGEVWEWEYKG